MKPDRLGTVMAYARGCAVAPPPWWVRWEELTGVRVPDGLKRNRRFGSALRDDDGRLTAGRRWSDGVAGVGVMTRRSAKKAVTLAGRRPATRG